MPFRIKTRYGAEKSLPDGTDVAPVVESLIRELETEQFEAPDDEHTQVAVSHGGWAVTVQVSGLMTLDDLRELTGSEDDVLAPPLYIRAESRAQAVDMLTKMAQGRIEELMAAGWVPPEQVPPYERDLFRESDQS